MAAEPSIPKTLLIHDGELADVQALLAELGTPLVERRGPPVPEDRHGGWDLVVATPHRMLELGFGGTRAPARIVVLDRDSRTLRASLKRADIDWMVLRPVHPVALRLLVVRALYRGPEKRRSVRLPMGAAVRIRSGLFKRQAGLLADLSRSGARLMIREPVGDGRRVVLALDEKLTGGRSLSLPARVVREASSTSDEHLELAVAFRGLGARLQRRLERVLTRFAGGPAVHGERDTASRPAGAPPSGNGAAPDTPPAPGNGASAPADRRLDPRHAISRRIIALGVEATRVLIGRDISVGGMRVDPEPSLDVGDRLRLALHVRARENPLVVETQVLRDDGESGLVLRFSELTDESQHYLQQMVNFLPILAMRDGDEAGVGLIVSEILEHHDAASEASQPA